MNSDQNDESLNSHNIVHALAFAAYLYARIAEETREISLAASRYAIETSSARLTIAGELAKTSDAWLPVEYDDTPYSTGDNLINQAWAVDMAIYKALGVSNSSAYATIIDGIIAAADRLLVLLNDTNVTSGAWQCSICQRLLKEKKKECPCGASAAALRPVWKDDNGRWYGYC